MKIVFNFILLIIFFDMSLAQNPCSQEKINHYQSLNKTHANTLLAARLMKKYDINHYNIHLLTPVKSNGYEGDVTFTATIGSPLDTVCFQMIAALPIDTVWINGQASAYSRLGADILVPLTNPLTVGQNLAVRVKYSGLYTAGNFFNGGMNKNKFYYTSDTALMSFSAIYTMKNWLPAKEMIYDKIDSVDMWVSTEINQKVGSNGILVKHDTVNNLSRFHWKSSYPIDYYLISIAVSDYEIVNSYVSPNNFNGDSILVQNYIYSSPNFRNFVMPLLDTNNMMLKYYSETFGLYPFANEKYGNCFVALSGGMEHQTMTTIGVPDISVLSHELFHQWFGDYVTCASWQDIAINEGFASYGEVLTEEFLHGKSAAVNYMANVHSSVLSAISGSVFCPDTLDENRVFSSRLTYDKGSAVIGTLRYILGDSLFFHGLKNFLQLHAYSTASFQDLKHDLETFTGINLNDYFNQWIYGQGYPIIKVKYRQFTNELIVRLDQTSSYPNSISFFKGPIDIQLKDNQGNEWIHKVDWQYQGQEFHLPFTSSQLSAIKIDPNYQVLHKVGSITMDTTLSIKDSFYTMNLQIFPIPFSQQLTMTSDTKIQSLVIYNSLGQMMTEVDQINNKTFQLKDMPWPSGTYILQLHLVNDKTISSILIKD